MDHVKKGKKSRSQGNAFELRVRKELESKGWVVFKNSNNLKDGEYIISKPKFNPVTKQLMMMSGGFPDFLCLHKDTKELLFVESKMTGVLDKQEKETCDWINKELGQDVFVAYKVKIKNKVEVAFKTYKQGGDYTKV
jgi:type I site-specific restriction endonuclease